MRIEAIPPHEVVRWWDFIRPGIIGIKRRCKERWIPEQVFAKLAYNSATLYIFKVDGEPKGFAVLEICVDSLTQHRFVNFWLMHFPHNAIQHRQQLVEWCDATVRQVGLKHAQFASPRLWETILGDAFKPRLTIFEREVNG